MLEITARVLTSIFDLIVWSENGDWWHEVKAVDQVDITGYG